MRNALISKGTVLYNFFLLGFLILSGDCLYAQNPYIKRIYINRENNNLKFTEVMEGHDGFLWFGANEGVYKYDGSDAVLYALNIKDFDNTVSALYQDEMDTLWIGYKSGRVACLIHNEIKLFVPEEGLPQKPITCLSKDSHGHLWIATAGEGVYYYNGQRLFNINMDDGLSENYAYSLAPDHYGNMWIGTDEGLSLCTTHVKNKVIKAIHKHDGLPDNIIRVLVPDRQGNLWIGMQENGICKYIPSLNKIEIPPQAVDWKFGQVNSISFDETEIWVGTDENGMVYLDGKPGSMAKSYAEGNSYRFPKILNSVFDTEGNIWIISNANIYQSSGSKVVLVDKVMDLPVKMVHTLMYDSKGNLWFTPDQGLVCYSFNDTVKNRLKQFTITPAEELIDIVSLYEDGCGYIWIGTMGAGLFRLNPVNGKIQKITGSLMLNKASVMSIAGRGESLWVATLGGAVKLHLPYDCNTDEIVPEYQNLDSEDLLGKFYLYDVFVDSKGRVWFGTDGKGLTCLDHGTYLNYNGKVGLKNNVVTSITEDEMGNIWFNVQNAGIYKYNGSVFKNYGIADGLRYLSVSAIESDGKGNIIIVHNHGFDVLDISRESFIYYGSEVGISDLNSDLNSIAKDRHGHICIGSEDKIIRYAAIGQRYARKPKSVITKTSLFTNELQQHAGSRLSYDQNYLSFDFTGLWYTNPDRVKFKYLLEGFNKEWVPTRDRRVIFPNLSPGKYTFKIRTSLNKNFNQYTEDSFSFRIQPPFWKEGWFILMVSIILGMIIYIFIKSRIGQIRRFESLKKEKIEYQYETLRSQVNPHFLFNSFNTLITEIEDNKDAAIEYVENLSAFFRHIVTFKDYDLITLEEELEIASNYFFLQQKRYGKNLELDIQVSDASRRQEIPPMIIQILIENALKHNAISSETPLYVSIHEKGNKLEIRNNINPKRTMEPTTQTGLNNIINRYKLLTKEEVEIIQNEKEFIVMVPLIG